MQSRATAFIGCLRRQYEMASTQCSMTGPKRNTEPPRHRVGNGAAASPLFGEEPEGTAGERKPARAKNCHFIPCIQDRCCKKHLHRWAHQQTPSKNAMQSRATAFIGCLRRQYEMASTQCSMTGPKRNTEPPRHRVGNGAALRPFSGKNRKARRGKGWQK